MKILMLIPFLPNISTSGGQTRWYNILKYLSVDHEITLYTLIKDDSEKKYISPLRRYCKEVKIFKRPKTPWNIRNILLASFTWYPLLVIRNFSWKEKRSLKKELSKNKYDLIHAETFYVMPHLPKTSIPSILVDQTIEYKVYKHFVDNEVPFILKPIFMIDVFKLRFWERYYWRKTNRLVAVSDEDRKIMQAEIPKIEVDVIPNGIDSDYFDAREIARKSPPRVLYGVAGFKWLQNIEAADILIDEVWSRIKKEVSEAILWIVGNQIPKRIIEKAKSRSDMEISESIPDKRDAYKGASIAVMPIKGPGGTRLKVFEAMASGLPVVSTKIGFAGLKVKNGIHALVADSNNDLAQAAIKLLKNPILAERIGKNGQKLVRKYYDWKSIVKLHYKIYEKAINYSRLKA